MKPVKIISGLFILIILTASATYAQQQFTHTVTAKNKYCNATCSIMDVRELNDNPAAVILVTPSPENARNLNPHPVGVYYVPSLKKWSITNTDGTAIVEGAEFNVEYYARPDANQIVYVVPPKRVPCVDHPSLNVNPNAQIRFSPTGSPRGALFNPDEVKIEYDASAFKWCLANVNNTPVPSDTAYNLVIDRSIKVVSNAPLPPLIVIVRTEWTIPFQSPYALSPGSCSVIKGGYINPAILITDSVIVAPQYGQGANLRWTAEAGNGSLVITVCNNGNSGSSQSYLSGKKINILVLR